MKGGLETAQAVEAKRRRSENVRIRMRVNLFIRNHLMAINRFGKNSREGWQALWPCHPRCCYLELNTKGYSTTAFTPRGASGNFHSFTCSTIQLATAFEFIVDLLTLASETAPLPS